MTDRRQRQSWLAKLISERAAKAYFALFALGSVYLVIRRFLLAELPLQFGLLILAPLLIWICVLGAMALPVLLVLRGFSARRDGGDDHSQE